MSFHHNAWQTNKRAENVFFDNYRLNKVYSKASARKSDAGVQQLNTSGDQFIINILLLMES